MRRIISVLSLAALIGLNGCDKDDETSAEPPVRPVLSVVLKPADETRIGFAGTIQPRYQTDRGFRVLGRIVSRDVDVGDVVKTGQKIAENDRLPYELAVRSSEADLLRAKSELERTTAAKERTTKLVGDKVSSQADLDATTQGMDAAAAAVQQAEAALTKSREQLSYTILTADLDGVVTNVNAQVGQMASPGMTVMTIARTDVREAVVDLPEGIVQSLEIGTPFEITLQADTSIKMTGKTREIAPQADAATRTRRTRITLDQSADPFRLGSTITAVPLISAGPPAIEVPLTALLERDGATRVWVVDEGQKKVRTVPVVVAERGDRLARIAEGLDLGTRVVTAGVHSLSEGQVVKIDAGDAK